MEGRDLTILSWNLGYGGLGAETDFAVEGGRRWRAETADLPRRWTAAIADFLAARDEDVLLLQEVARPSWANHRADLLGALNAVFAARPRSYAHEIRIPFPFGLGNEMGCLIVSRPELGGAFDATRLPGHGRSFLRQYPALCHRFECVGARFSLLDAHLSAFDAGARLRARQLEALLRLGQQELAAGRHVVIGADFNYELCPPPARGTTDAKLMAWLHPFPHEALPRGWRIACDPAVPTFRSGDRPYRRGENYCGVIDGFIVSPNVDAVRVAAIDLGFAASDHNPVAIAVRPR